MRRIIFIIIIIMSTGCGGAKEETPKVISVKDYETSTFSVEAKDAAVEGLLGTVTDDEIHRVFDNNMRYLLKCYEDEVFELEEMEGSLTFELEVASEGTVNHAFIRESSLGSLETESCMLRKVEGFTFQRQPGGIAVLSYPLELLPAYDHPAPKPLTRADIGDKIDSEYGEDVSGCLNGGSGVVLTFYIGQGGMVLAAGASAYDVDTYESAMCLAKAARGWRFDDPGNDLAKATIDF